MVVYSASNRSCGDICWLWNFYVYVAQKTQGILDEGVGNFRKEV
mgnify:CR=1 FL=1|jgi:hypothetical protein